MPIVNVLITALSVVMTVLLVVAALVYPFPILWILVVGSLIILGDRIALTIQHEKERVHEALPASEGRPVVDEVPRLPRDGQGAGAGAASDGRPGHPVLRLQHEQLPGDRVPSHPACLPPHLIRAHRLETALRGIDAYASISAMLSTSQEVRAEMEIVARMASEHIQEGA